jgi:oligopeptide transport system ATP-binding protein
MHEPLLRVEKLNKHFPVHKNVAFVFRKTAGWVKAVDGIDFVIYRHQSLGLVGESGCGKTTTSMLILKLFDPTSGNIWFHEKNIANIKGRKLKEYRRSVQAMFQDPYSSLNPRMKIGTSIGEPLLVNGVPKNEIKERVIESLVQVGLDKGAYNLFPHEFSGGQRQRIALARSIILKPELVILDEPVSALDVSVRAQVMNLLKSIQETLGLSYLMIAHHLGTIRYLCHWTGVMYLGKIVELATSEELFTHPMHPYTIALLSATLPSHPDQKKSEIVLPGEVPSPINIPSGCRFHVRCLKAGKHCSDEEPVLKQVNNEHFVACHLY